MAVFRLGSMSGAKNGEWFDGSVNSAGLRFFELFGIGNAKPEIERGHSGLDEIGIIFRSHHGRLFLHSSGSQRLSQRLAKPLGQLRVVVERVGGFHDLHQRRFGSIRRLRFCLGDALDCRQQMLAHFRRVRADGQAKVDLIGNDVVLGASLDVADGDDGGIARLDFARHDGLQASGSRERR